MARLRATASVVAMATLLMLIVGGGSGGAASTEAASTAEKVAASASQVASGWQCNVKPPASNVTVHFYGWTFPIMDYYANELKQCSSVKNITVTTQLLDSATVDQQVALALGSGSTSPYDIIHASNPEIDLWGLNGWLRPLDGLIKKYGKKYGLADINSAAWKGATVNGHIYGIPLGFNTLGVLAYRSDLLKKYHLGVPKTYDQIIKDCSVLKHDSSIDLPFAFDVSAGWAWEFEFFNFLRSYGGHYTNPDGTPAFDSPAGVAALTKMKEVVDACMGGANVTRYGYEQNEVAMNNGGLAMTQIWATATQSMNDPTKSHYSHDIKFAVGLQPKRGSLVDGSAWEDFYVIPKKSRDNPDLLFRLIMQVADKQSQEGAAKLGLITRNSVKQVLPVAKVALETIKRGVGKYPVNLAIPEAQTALANYLPLVGSGKMSPRAALDAAAKKYTTLAKAKGIIK